MPQQTYHQVLSQVTHNIFRDTEICLRNQNLDMIDVKALLEEISKHERMRDSITKIDLSNDEDQPFDLDDDDTEIFYTKNEIPSITIKGFKRLHILLLNNIRLSGLTLIDLPALTFVSANKNGLLLTAPNAIVMEDVNPALVILPIELQAKYLNNRSFNQGLGALVEASEQEESEQQEFNYKHSLPMLSDYAQKTKKSFKIVDLLPSFFGCVRVKPKPQN